MSGCVCSAPVDRCVPARTTTWPTTARAWRDQPPPSHHSVSLQLHCTALHVHMQTTCPAFTSSNLKSNNSDSAYKMLAHEGILPPQQLPPQGRVKFSVRTAGAASSTPVRLQSVAASPATPERDARSTSAGITARTEARALLHIQVSARHTCSDFHYSVLT